MCRLDRYGRYWALKSVTGLGLQLGYAKGGCERGRYICKEGEEGGWARVSGLGPSRDGMME